MFDLRLGLLMLLGSAALWPVRRGVVRARMGRLTPSETEWQVVQAEVMLEGFMAFGVIALLGLFFGPMITWEALRLSLFASVVLHVLAAASVAVAIESARRPGFTTRGVLISIGAAWPLVIAAAVLISGTEPPSRTLTAGAPVAILIGLTAYGFAFWRFVGQYGSSSAA